MLAKARRLTAREFSAVMERGSAARSPSFTLIIAPGASFRISATISKKLAKSAVERNRVRRRVYAAVRKLMEGKDICPASAVVIAQRKIDALGHAALVAEIGDLFVKARLIA